MGHHPPYLSILLLSAGSLAYEILLMRLFSIIQWHHFAYMIIGLALLGYGISGTLVSLFQKYLLSRYSQIYLVCLLLFSLFTVISFLVAQTIPFNAEEILWDWHQSIYLLLIFLLLAIPFFFAASAICLTLMQYSAQISRVYAVDLIGAGMGSIGVVYLLFMLFPQSALLAISLLGLITVVVAVWELRLDERLRVSLVLTIAILLFIASGQTIELHISPYKGLEQSLRVAGTRIIEQRSSPLGLLSVIESKRVPLRHAPGLSLNASQEPPEQLGVFTDADNLTAITRSSDKLERLSYLDQMSSALPYHLVKPERVLIVGAGGGSDILQARFHQAPRIDAIELNPQMVDLVSDRFRAFSSALYDHDNVNIHIGDARDYLRVSAQDHDLIQLALLDTFNASTSGLYALNENYLYTVEALQIYLDHLKTDGYLAITRWIKIPPRDTLKLFATAIDALKKSGVQAPEKRLVLIRSWQTSTLLVKNGEVSEQEIDSIKTFCRERSFDVAYVPGISEQQANQYNILQRPIFYRGATALLSAKRQQFMDQYKFNLEPATDDRPYYHHFFKWTTLVEVIQLRGKGGMPLIEWGYMILVATLIIALLVSVLLILLPMFYFQRHPIAPSGVLSRVHVVLYFFLIGLAFLFIEIAFMQKFILFLHHPIYAISVTLSAFLVFAGMGSYWSRHLGRKFSDRQTAVIAVVAISLLSLSYLLMLDHVFNHYATAAVNIRILLTILLIAPLAFFMGMPFPSALSSLQQYDRHFIPWAWGVNGCASVISAVLASLLAIHFGFTVVIVLAILLYIAILFLFPLQKIKQA